MRHNKQKQGAYENPKKYQQHIKTDDNSHDFPRRTNKTNRNTLIQHSPTIHLGQSLKDKYQFIPKRVSFGTRNADNLSYLAKHQGDIFASISNLNKLEKRKLSNKQLTAIKTQLIGVIKDCRVCLNKCTDDNDKNRNTNATKTTTLRYNKANIRKILHNAVKSLNHILESEGELIAKRRYKKTSYERVRISSENISQQSVMQPALRTPLPLMSSKELIRRLDRSLLEHSLKLDVNRFSEKHGMLVDSIDRFNEQVDLLHQTNHHSPKVFRELQILASHIEEETRLYCNTYGSDKTQEKTCQIMEELWVLAAWRSSLLGKNVNARQL